MTRPDSNHPGEPSVDTPSGSTDALDERCSTLAHETTHWTAHESRLARDVGTKRFGSEGSHPDGGR